MKLAFVFLIASLALAGASPEIDHFEDGKIILKDGKSLQTGLFEMANLGLLQPMEGLPYFILSAKTCKSCSTDQQLYLVRADGGKIQSFVFPGKILNPGSRTPAVDSRAFYGSCLPAVGPAYVTVQKEIIDKKRHHRHTISVEPSVFYATPRIEPGPAFDEKLQDLRSIRQFEAKLKSILSFVRRKQCFEIPGWTRPMSAHPIALKYQSEKDEDEEEDDTSPNPKATLVPGDSGGASTVQH